MSKFVNADQDGLLADVSSRHKSGLEGGLVFQVKEGSDSTNLVIKDNKIYGDIGEILNVNDLDALIEIGGEVTGVAIDGNTLNWAGTVTVGSDVDAAGSIINQGILLYGNVNGAGALPVVIKNNVFQTTDIAAGNYESSAIFMSTTSVSGLGILKSDVSIYDDDSVDYAAWEISSDVGNYGTSTNAQILVFGEPGTVYADGVDPSNIQYLDTDYSSIII